MNSIASGYMNSAPAVATGGASPQAPTVKVVILQRQVNKSHRVTVEAAVAAVETVGVMVMVGLVSD